MKTGFKVFCIIAILGLALGLSPIKPVAADTVVPVYVLDPSWDAIGGGGVFAAYIGPAAYDYVSPGLTAYYNGREAGIIKAGLTVDPTSGHFEDEGIFGFKPTVTIDVFAAGTVNYDVITQAGVNPVWMTIEIDTGIIGNRDDNTTYQHVPTSNPAGWHTVNAAAGLWAKWDDNNGTITTPAISLASVAAAHTGLNVVRAYLRLGMGDSYNNGGTGTYAWVDQVTLGGFTYDFQLTHPFTWWVSPTGSDSNFGTEASPFLTIQKAIDASQGGDTINVTAGTYVLSSAITINKDVTLNGIGNPLIQVSKPDLESGNSERIIMMTAGATLQGFYIEKTDTDGPQNIIYVGANNLTIQNNRIWGHYVYPAGDVSRAMVFTGGLSGLLIDNNEIFDLRQPAYISGVSTGTISNNFVYRTKGWVLEQGNMTFTGNTWGTGADANIFDIAILSVVNSIYYTNVPAMSAANNGAVIEDQRLTSPLLSVVYVDDNSTCTVDCGGPARPYSTITAGIARVMAGGTVNVAAGTYAEQITISKPLTLNGADGAVLDGDTLTAEWTTGVKIRTGNVTFNNIDVTNYTQDGITAYDNIDMPNLHITNSKISNIQPGYWGFGIYVGYESEGFGYIPPHLTTHLDFSGLLIEGNEITNVHSSALVIQSLTGTAGSLIVRNNNIHDNTTNSGIWVDCARNLLIENNTVDGNKWGVEFSCYAEASQTLNGTYGPKDIVLSDNVITDSTSDGIAIYEGWPGTLDISDNTLTGNTPAIHNYLAASTDASPNWFGTATGPAAGQITGLVSFVPWCLTSECTTFGYPPVHNITQDTYFATIQAAINAAVTDDEIHVSPGTYVESLDIIGKNIILRAPSGATIESPVDIATDFTTALANSAVVYVNTSTSTIDGFTIDGASHGNANYRFYGVAFYNAGGTIQNLTVRNIQDTPFSGAQHGNAIYAYNADGVARTLNVTGNTVYDFQKNGITMNGALLTANVDDNTVTCKGTINITAQNGIQFGYGSTGTITNNTISGCSYNKDSDATYNWSATGILLAGSGAVTITGNDISGNSQNLYISDPTAAITVGANTFGAVTAPVGLSYQVINWSDFDVDLSLSTFEGLLLSGATPEQLLAFAARVFDGIDYPGSISGVASLQTGYQFVDAEGSIQAAIDAATPGDIIMVAAGTYDENVIVNKTVEIFGAGQGSTIVIPAISGANPASCASLCALASNVFLVQANDVTIHDLTVDGNNPDLTGITSGGVDVDARNGIIANHSAGVFNNLEVYNTTVQNIFLRGIYPSSGGTFNVHHNTVTNVQGNTSSIAIFGWGGPGTFANNTVSYANDAISANHSKGIQFLNNTVTYSGSGIHTDNSGDSAGSVSDVITGNTVSNCPVSGYGIWTFVNYLPITVSDNTVTGCEIAYSVWGGKFTSPSQLVQFNNNTATAPVPNTNSVGIYITTDTIGWGYTDVLASFTGNTITGFENGVYMTVDPQSWNPGTYALKTITSTFLHNQITGSTTMAVDLGTTPFLSNMEANWWGSAVKADLQAKIDGSIDFNPWCGDAACSFLIYEVSSGYSIQAAINAASPGDTVLVGPGTYNESLIINKALTLKSTDGAATTILDVPDGTLTTGIKVLGTNLGEVTIDGFTVKDFTEGGIIQGMASHEGTTVHVLNNIVIPAGNYLRNGIQVSGDYSTVIGNYVQGAHLTADWSGTGILIVNASHVLVENNTVYGNGFGMDTGIGVANWNAGLTISDIIIRNNTIDIADYAFSFTNWTATSVIDGVVFENNLITNFTTGIDAYNNGTISNVDASPNWWGTIAGPTAGQMLLPGAVYSPWCGETSCTRLYPIQTGIPANTLTTWDKSYNWTGIPGASWYILNVRNATGVLIKNIWVSAADAQCNSDLSCTYVIPGLELTNALYSWRVEDYGAYGHGLWTEYKPFVLNVAPMNTVLSPLGTMTSWDKSFQWTGNAGATWYVLQVFNSTGAQLKYLWVSAADAQCASDTSCSYVIPGLNLLNGNYSWRVQNYGGYGYGRWTANQAFVLNISPLSMIISPKNTMTTWDKSFQWTGNTGATWYVLQVMNSTNAQLKYLWVSAADAQCASDTSCTYVIPGLNLVNGNYSWRVQNYGAYGYGQWTTYQPFVLAIAPINTLVSPLGTVSGWDKTFQWTGNAGATWYVLNVRNASDVLIKNIWVSAADAQCASDTSCTYIIPSFNLANGSYSWRVQNYGAYGYGQWTAYQAFLLQ